MNRGRPASGSAGTHPGLQPSLYHLPPPPPPHGLYSYPMLDPAQLEAWRQYQSGTLHTGTPYSLQGYMSRFPPGGLHGHHHPGISPGAALGPHRGHPHTLPHIKPEDQDTVSNVNHQLNHHGSIHRGEKEREAEKEYLVKKKDVNHMFSPGGHLRSGTPWIPPWSVSPGAALGLQGGHPNTLPYIKPADLDAFSNVNHHLNHHGSIHRSEKEDEKECLVKKEDVNHIPKPLNALHAGSPYSLPINTSGLISRIVANVNHQLELHESIHGGEKEKEADKECLVKKEAVNHIPKPGYMSRILDNVNNHGSIHRGEKEKEAEKECLVKKKDVTRIPKPLNAFMLYMQEMRPVVKAECTLKESAAINKILGKEILESYLFCKYLGSLTSSIKAKWQNIAGSIFFFFL